MSSLFVVLFFLFPYFVSPATSSNTSRVINLNERIHANIKPTALYSPSGRFAFGFLPEGDGFLVGIWIVGDTNSTNSQNIMVWTANQDHPPVSSNATIELTGNGKLILNGEILIDPPEPAIVASMQDSGNFVMYGENSNVIWESFNFPTDTILGGQKLSAEKELLSKASPSDFSTGRFCLKMQSDGNLVAYPSKIIPKSTDSYWSTGTSGSVDLHLDKNGALKLEGGFNSTVIKQLNENYSGDMLTTIYRATLDPDGNLRVYFNTSTNPLWEAFNDTCAVKSFCGYNSYCSSSDNEPLCNCVPGTDLINYSENYNGCQRNFTKQKCADGKADTRFYYMTTMEKVKWEDVPYFNAPMSEEDCKNSCLEDCDCDAAEYYSTTICTKYKFPLKYVSPYIQRNSTTFLKGGTKRTNRTIIYIEPPLVLATTSKKTWLLILLLTLFLVTYSCVALATFGLFIFKIRVIEYKKLLESGTSGLAKELTLRLYSYKELKEATKGFKEELGKGSFVAVYKGTISEKLVAVKRLQKLVEEGEREFQSEMRVIGKTHHKNLVRLLGYCT